MAQFKITVIGDIMCEPPLMEQAKSENRYDFGFAFRNIKGLLSEADYVIGNLETPLAGKGAIYTNTLVSFNAPDSFASAVKESGLDMVSTANNHALDRGIKGLARTLTVLDKAGLMHTGTYADNTTKDRIHYFNARDAKIAVVAYTTSTNFVLNQLLLDKEHDKCINYLRPPDAPGMGPALPQHFVDVVEFIEDIIKRKLAWEEKILLKRVMGINISYSDDFFDSAQCAPYLNSLAVDYREAKNNDADIVILCPHTGGQFNSVPGSFSNFIVHRGVEIGFDAILAAHSHTSQKAVYLNGVPCFYSLGNVTMCQNTFYVEKKCLPEYGLAAHMYVEDKEIQKTTFSIFKIVEMRTAPLTVYPVDELFALMKDENDKDKLEKDIETIYRRVSGEEVLQPVIRREYELNK